MAKNRLTVSIIGCAGVPAKYGGFETLAEQLCLHLYQDIDMFVFCSTKTYTQQEIEKKWQYGKRIFIPLKAHGFSSILFDLKSLIKAVRFSDTILILGGSGGLFLPLLKLCKWKTTYIFHPDGMEWERKKWNLFSKIFLFVSIKTACRFSTKIIIDNQGLLNHYKKYKSKTEVIEYGGDQFLENARINSIKKNYWLTIARAEPENNLSIIVETFKKLKEHHWILITNWTKTKYGKRLYNELKSISNITILDAIYDKDIIASYFNDCKGYIHGHSTGGTNPSLVSAMWFNKPIICHDNIFNRITTQNHCYYFLNSEKLIAILKQSDIKEDENVLILAEEKYRWETIAQKYLKLFCSDKIC